MGTVDKKAKYDYLHEAAVKQNCININKTAGRLIKEIKELRLSIVASDGSDHRDRTARKHKYGSIGHISKKNKMKVTISHTTPENHIRMIYLNKRGIHTSPHLSCQITSRRY